ncbi:MAG: hypothetical protein CVU46_08870 [Chloroflexi bacterium HGW-Chloroflexi-8]|nr:MAG: hypothetical protein CVU46_08870 [Chloroflexi bacterium HGW-Chloroflexi-8]
MNDIILFLSQNEIWFYVILGGISIYLISKLFIAIALWRDAAFGMERDIAQRKFGTSLTFLILIFLLALSEFFLVSYSSSFMPDVAKLATPTIDLLASPTATLSFTPDTIAQSTLVTLTPTITQDGCIPGQLEWISPTQGGEVSDVVKLIGTVNIPNFGFYKYEYTEPGNPIWKTIAGGNVAKNEEEIGAWNTTQLIPGDYLLRLIVLDNQNIEFPACIVQVRVIIP